MKRLSFPALLLSATTCFAFPASAVVINDDHTTDDAVDDEDVNGVGALLGMRGNQICSGTLINPRTVVFAAHCVNAVPYSYYVRDDVQLAWSFARDANAGRSIWLENGFQTDVAENIYTVSQIIWNPQSKERYESGGWKEADLAVATLDTPARGIPTWAMLFAPLPDPGSSDPVRGTGYHVDIYGYGWYGTGTDGAVSRGDFRRRAAENMLGGLGALNSISYYQYKRRYNYLPQPVYLFDFDDPLRQTQWERNSFPDDALAREGTTAAGDSGGPLILDAANNQGLNVDLLIAVLSGGQQVYSWQPGSAYGDYSIYNPLFLQWHWIAENNPYRYVGAKAGNGRWENPNHWQSQLDPAYYIIDEDGNYVPGTPARFGAGIYGRGPGFGQFCNPRDEEPCVDLSETENGGWLSEAPLPQASIENGLPGATGFVPNNLNFVFEQERDLFFDVTLAAPGVTSLGSAVAIDRLTVRDDASLLIDTDGHLTVINQVIQAGRYVNIDGRLTTPGDYLLSHGWLLGEGVLEAAYVTNVAGIIFPGHSYATTEMKIEGHLILSSGASLLVNVLNGQSSKLIVTGDVSLGGTVYLSGDVAFGDTYSILEFGGVGEYGFDQVIELVRGGPLSRGVLFANLNYLPGHVDITIDAQSLAAHLYPERSATQASIGAALDSARDSAYGALSSVYQSVDGLGPRSLGAAFDELTPNDAILVGQSLLASGEALHTRVGARLRQARGAGPGQGGFANIDRFEAEAESGLAGRDAQLDGYAMTAGLDQTFENGVMVGLLASYNHTESEFHTQQRSSETDGLSIGGYGSLPLAAARLEGHFSLGRLEVDTARAAGLSAQTQQVTSTAAASVVLGGLRLSRSIVIGETAVFTPSLNGFAAQYRIDGYRELGTAMALAVEPRKIETAQISIAGALQFNLSEHIRPSVRGAFVEEIGTRHDRIEARFAAAPESDAFVFAGPKRAPSWYDLHIAVDMDLTDQVAASLNLRQTLERDELSQTVLGATIQISF